MKSQRYGRSHPRSGFTPEEDCLLIDLVAQFGNDSWTTISSFMEKRNARQCKDRYMSYLSPTINNGPYSEEEDDLLRKKYNEIGPKWVKISKFFPNRTDISVKCRWAVLNRRDMKLKEKKLCNIHSKNSKQKGQKKSNLDDDFYEGSDSTNSSSPIDPDFRENSSADSIFMQKRNGSNRKRNSSNSKSRGSSMTIRKRSKRKNVYCDEIEQTIQKSSPDNDSPISAPSSLASTDNDSSANSPGTNIKSTKAKDSPAFSIENSPGQNQTQLFSADNQPKSIFSLNNGMLFDSFPSFNFGKVNDESCSIENNVLFNSAQTTFNEGMMKNENFNNFNNNLNRNLADGLNRPFFCQGSCLNNFQQNKKNNVFNTYPSAFSQASTSAPLNNMNTLFNDKNKIKLDEDVFADDLNWDISWDISLNDVKENTTSVNLF